MEGWKEILPMIEETARNQRKGRKRSKMQSSENDEGPEKIFARLLELAEEIYDLTTRQTEAIRSEDWDGLKAILDEKDRRSSSSKRQKDS